MIWSGPFGCPSYWSGSTPDGSIIGKITECQQRALFGLLSTIEGFEVVLRRFDRYGKVAGTYRTIVRCRTLSTAKAEAQIGEEKLRSMTHGDS